MSGLDGFATCTYLKSQNSTKKIPIIVMMALSAAESHVKSFGLGAVDYITKPINREVLLARIKNHLDLQSLNQRLAQELEWQKLLSEMSDRIRKNLKLESIFQNSVREIQAFFDCDRVWLAHLDEEEIFLESVQKIVSTV